MTKKSVSRIQRDFHEDIADMILQGMYMRVFDAVCSRFRPALDVERVSLECATSVTKKSDTFETFISNLKDHFTQHFGEPEPINDEGPKEEPEIKLIITE